ncbi:MAG: hypothetical protein HYY20_03305 [Candidatus Tectomicrobia bacterium]|uniref:Uncharacterized protein n=1 Tax=Tectimicrobiota bacterium TaxID=2528274 RepID=A0A932CMI9_UNCTE|nr:hypothetical protein [Candidatus Tectomicrobia bacterium]
MPAYRGIVKDNVVVLPEGVHLDEGLIVEVRIPPVEANPSGPDHPEDRFKQRLVELGLLKEIKIPSVVPGGDRTPIQVKGKPLSQTIIEERR